MTDETSFYENISRYYDEIFAVDPQEIAFWRRVLNDAVPALPGLLDIGCGTGSKTEQLASAASQIVALDNDRTMIAAARRDHGSTKIEYRLMDMEDLGQEQAPAFPALFDAALCLGNTLVHLTSPGKIRDFLTRLNGLLKPGGILGLQILNYERILRLRVTNLPVLETARVRFSRFYDFEESDKQMLVRFRTELLVKGHDDIVKGNGDRAIFGGSILLYPLRRAELAEILKDAGYQILAFYGGYGAEPQKFGTPCGPNSFVTIAVCRSHY
jgi:SAM-dependent methyltransferase